MAGVTGTGGFAIFFLLLMAIATFYSSVLSFELEVSQVMIKCQFVQFDNINVTTLVISMADATFLRANFFVSAMVTGFTVYILEDIFMACNTQV